MIPRFKELAALFSSRDKLHFAGLLGLMFVGSLLDVVGVGAVPAFVAALAIPERVMQYPIVASVLGRLGITTARQLVLWGCVGLTVVYLLKNAFLSLMYYAQVRTTERYRVSLARHLFESYMKAPYELLLGRNTAELLRNVNLETKEIIAGVINPILSAAMGVLMTSFIVILLVVATPWVALIGIGIMGFGSWLFAHVVKDKLLHFGKEAQHQRRMSIQAVNQGLGSLQEARILGREGYFIAAFHRSIILYAKADRLRQFVSRVSSRVLEFIAVLGLLLIVLFIVLIGTDMMSLIPTLALLAAAIVRLRATISQVVNGISQIRYSIAAVTPIFDDLNLMKDDVRIQRISEADALPAQETTALRLNHTIAFEGVEYSYPNTKTLAIRDINLSIGKGMSVAFVGATGSGKTTMVNVLLGLLKPQRGRITVDGTDIKSNLRGWRANIGYIPQTIFLLDDTIRRNIALGLRDEEIEEEKIWSAIRAAQMEDFVRSLEDDVETVVGERGVGLSGGQRQRIGLARALYHNPEVLIMDEATSSLDNYTESLVMKALEGLKEERTFIIIAHRLSTVHHCDRLHFIQDGRIKAIGTYDELHLQNQDFRRMAEIA